MVPMKKLLISMAAILIVVMLVFPASTSARPDMDKPLPASNVEIIKKITVKGPKAPAAKPSKSAATGTLGTPCNGEKYSIVIGISDYPGSSNDLEYADDDAALTRDVLEQIYGFKQENIYLITNSDATFNKIKETIAVIKGKASSNDEVVFFFSGHGAKGQADDGDAEKIDEAIVSHDNNNLVFIWDGQLKEWFSGFPTSRIVFIFDSCMAGGMDDLAANGRVISMACSETGVSYEGDAWGGHGQFTYYFIEQGMSEGLADKYDNILDQADVTVEEAFDYARLNCQWQSPVISDSFLNDLLP